MLCALVVKVVEAVGNHCPSVAISVEYAFTSPVSMESCVSMLCCIITIVCSLLCMCLVLRIKGDAASRGGM